MTPLEWSDDEIKEMSAVDRLAIGAALVWWQQRAPRRRRRELNEATPGKPVDRRTLDRTIGTSAAFLVALSRLLQNKSMKLDVWQSSFAQEIVPLHLAMAGAAAGGTGALTLDDTALVEQRTQEQLEFLRNFALGIAAGDVLLDGRLLRRAEMYAEAGRGSYHDERLAVMMRTGFDQERSIRNARDSCITCIDQELKGWQPIGQMIPIGRRICLSRCMCWAMYRNSATGEESL